MSNLFALWPRILLLGVLLCPGALLAQGEVPSPRITIVAEGEARATPDMATLTLGVEQRGKTAGAAMEALQADLAGVFAALQSFALPERDIQTSGLNLAPLRNRQGSLSEDQGFLASSSVTLRVRDLTQLGPLIDAVVRGGANRFRGLSYGLADPKPLLDQARRAAVAEALRRAALYAGAAGVAQGALLSISEAPPAIGGPVVRGAFAQMEVAEAVPLASGEVTVSVSITAVFGAPE